LIIYLDTSALIKLYIQEAGSAQVREQVNQADLSGTIDLTKVEMAAAFAKAVRMRVISSPDLQTAWRDFSTQWPFLYQLDVSEALRERAIQNIWDHPLRGYDAMHLAAALIWQETFGEEIVLGTFDKALWQAGAESGLQIWPGNLETFYQRS